MTDAVWNTYAHCDQLWVMWGTSDVVSTCPACFIVVAPKHVDHANTLSTERDEMLTMLNDASVVLASNNDRAYSREMSAKINELLKRIKS